MIELTLPFPPSVNSYKKVGKLVTTKSGKKYQQRFNSPETTRYYYEVWFLIKNKHAREGLKMFDRATIALEVHLDLYPPDKRKSDIDNRVKICLDSLQRAGFIANDYQVARLVVTRCEPVSGGKVVVRVKELTHAGLDSREPG